MADELRAITIPSGTGPISYRVDGPITLSPFSAFASFNGSAAAASFRPALTILTQDGLVLARVFPSDTLAVGDTADVTYAPFLGRQDGGTTTVVVNGQNIVFPQQTGFWYATQFTNFGAATSTKAVGAMTVTPFYVPVDTSFDRIGVVKTSAADATHLFRLGIYGNVTTGISYPGALIVDAGQVDGSGGAPAEKSIVISETLSSGMYWLAGVPQSVGGFGARGYSVVQWINQTDTAILNLNPGGNPATYETTGITGALPDPHPSFGGATTFLNTAAVPGVLLRGA